MMNKLKYYIIFFLFKLHIIYILISIFFYFYNKSKINLHYNVVFGLFKFKFLQYLNFKIIFFFRIIFYLNYAIIKKNKF